MTSTTIARGSGTLLTLLALSACHRENDGGNPARAAAAPAAGAHQGLLHGRVTTTGGEVYEGRLRFGADEEALWGHYFNGHKDENPWAAQAPADKLPRERVSWKLLGVEIGASSRLDLGRPFMSRFGDIARIEARGRNLQVTLKSGTVFHLDRYAADDFADGVRVWDDSRGIVDLPERRIRSIEFLSARRSGVGPRALHGTVRTRGGDFTGLIQWDREAGLGPDQLYARSGEVGVQFEEIRSIARRSAVGAVLTLHDGREVLVPDVRRRDGDSRGMYVDDPRYGRVLVSWEAFQRLDFTPGRDGPAYREFRPGQPLRGTVITRSGQRLTGRLVYDLDESESTETLDAPAQGVDYTMPFALIGSIEPLGKDGARVTLHSGEQLHAEPGGDLAASNAGMLIFSEGRERPAYVPWADVRRVDFSRP